jgi:hypothetical protein
MTIAPAVWLIPYHSWILPPQVLVTSVSSRRTLKEKKKHYVHAPPSQTKVDSLCLVLSQQLRQLEIVDHTFVALKNGDDVQHVSTHLGKEAFGSVQVAVDLLQCDISWEHEQSEATIGRRKILDVDFTHVSHGDEYVRE